MLADDIRELHETPKHSCGIGKIINEYNGDDRVALIHLIDKSKVSSTKIIALLAKHGHSINRSKLNHHIRRLNQTGVDHCYCPAEM